MNVCVTGGAGMIGSALVKSLVKQGHQIVVIDNLWRGKMSHLEVNGASLIDVEKDFYQIDLSDLSFATKLVEIFDAVETVIHLADIVAGIGYVFSNEYEIFRVNNLINTAVFKSFSDSQAKQIIYVGTACSFPLELQQGLDSELQEHMLFPANPESAYGWSKLVGQLELKYLKQSSGKAVSTLMLHNVYGPNCEFTGERTQVIPSLMKRVIDADEGDTISVWGSGNQGRAFIHVDDIVNALVNCVGRDDLPEFMQVGPGVCTSIRQLIETIIEVSGKSLKVSYDTTKPEGDKGRYADYSIAQTHIGWTPKVTLKEGLAQTYRWIESADGK
jgi:GDP-D-mannose 3', 5'-epimerase